MKNVGAASFLLALASALAACPTPYGGPVSMPKDLGAAELADCHAFTPEVWDEGRIPRRALNVTARCADASICTAVVEHGEVVVWGLRAGATEVLVAYEHPTSGERGEAKVALSFAPPTREDYLHPRVRDPTHCRRDHERPQ